ncbi:ABC transporter permease [Leekyejoonella antrihumi]|uniref:ABC transporter permease n=1 Tax=Leekyejoonella antrihumi TaxID=1660198 RepID=A0A563DVZ7_9MICO|nr:ABC transporter permease [Leekyejoonella antrihumi]TWP34448.1 ABC transporter permease [Leekyejoonella antrihumi]
MSGTLSNPPTAILDPRLATGDAKPSLGGRLSELMRRRYLSVVSIVGALVIWELIAVLIVRDPVFLPTPIATVGALIHYWDRPYPSQGKPLWYDTYISLIRILVGFAIGTIIGIIIGGLMAAVRPIRSIIDPFIELTRPLPPLAFIPLLLVWFGLGETPKIVLITIGVIPIVTVSTAAAITDVPAELLHAARCLGASEFQTAVYVQIRAALPQIITGMRLAMGISWTSIVAAEFVAATAGLGYVILQAGQFLRTDLIFAGVLIIAVLGITLDALLRLLKSRIDPAGRSAQ